MKKTFLFVLCLILSLKIGLGQHLESIDNKVVKIACIGNSITYGSTIINREKNAYPMQLQEMLGSEFMVRNFGVSGATLLKQGDRPYMNTEAFKDAQEFNPDIVFIKLGTNDSKLKNRVFLNEFDENYKELIQSFKNKNEKARIVLLLPIPSFAEDTTSIWDPVIKNKIIPLIQKTAFETKSELIDLYQLFVDKPELLPDKIHPSSLGATVIAKRIYEAIVLKTDSSFNLIHNLEIDEVNESNFYGFEQHNFKFDGVSCKIVVPKVTLKDNPWIWRARFWGHEPQTDIALLERGFHLVYCDVADLFGGPMAVKRWNKFYDFLKDGGLSNKVVLEGMSRGGLIIYNWAVENPNSISCIYADAPVLDGKSWPGGFGKGQGYPTGWINFKKEYGLDSEASVANFIGNPIHKMKRIAKAGFPMLHVCGESDNVVTVDENTRVFEKKIKEYGGDITVIYKEGVGHHPHSLENPTPIVNFILRATGHKPNFAAIIAPGSEYRSAAGWINGADWWAQMEDIDSLCMNSGKIDLLLIGNSITQGWGGSRTLTTHKPGQQAAEMYFKDLKWICAGISGDRTEHIAWRLENGHYIKSEPKVVTLAIGVNNFPYNSAEEIANGIEFNIKLIKEKLPEARILLFGPLPTGLTKGSDRRKKYDEIHELISFLGDQHNVHYSNLIELFLKDDGSLNMDYYGADGIHLKPKGYEIWAEYIKKQMIK